LLRKPYGRTKALISRTMAKNIFGQALYQLTVTFGLMFFGNVIFDIDDGKGAEPTDPPSIHFTMIFNAFVMMTLFNEINARKIHGQRNVFIGLFSNPIYYVIWIATFIGQIAIIQFGGIAFSTAPLNLEQWIWCIFLGLGTLVWQQIITTIPNSCIPKSFSYGRQPPPEPTSPIAISANEVGHHHHHHDHHASFSGSRSGQILWIRGLTRLQTQLRVIRAFRSTLEDMEEKRSVHSLRSTRSYLSRPMSDISYVDEDTLSPSAASHNRRSFGTGSSGQPATSNNNKQQQSDSSGECVPARNGQPAASTGIE